MFKKILSVLISVSFMMLPVRAFALPNVDSYNNAEVSITSDATSMTIEQAATAPRTIIDYNSFNIAQPETVTFNQLAGSQSIALNRIHDVNPSQILGTLTANGRIFLVNPNGVVFGQDCTVNTAGLVASSLNMATSDADFMNPATTSFSFSGGGAGAVTNAGALNAPGGFIALLGPSVQNSGMIAADLGTVALASGSAMTLALDGLNLISVVVDAAADPGSAAAGVINSNKLQAEGGKVWINGQVVDAALKNAVNNAGVIEAKEIQITGNGDIEILAGSQIKAEDCQAAGVDILSTGTGSEVLVDGALISAKVEGAGDAYVNVRSGDYGLEDILDDVDEVVGVHEQLNGSGKVTIKNSSILEASAGAKGEDWENARVVVEAKNIAISDSSITAASPLENEGAAGEARVYLTAGDYDYYHYWGESQDRTFTGGNLDILNSDIKASVEQASAANTEESFFQGAKIDIEGRDVSIDNSRITAESRLGGGKNHVYITGSDYAFVHEGENYLDDSYSCGSLDIINKSQIKASVKVAGEADIGLVSGADGLRIDDSNILAQVGEYESDAEGNAFINMRSGKYSYLYLNDGDSWIEYEKLFDGKTDILSSIVTSRVYGTGESGVEIRSGKTVDVIVPTCVTVGNSSLTAEVTGAGAAFLNIFSGDFVMNPDMKIFKVGCDQEYNEDFFGDSLAIQDRSSLMALAGAGEPSQADIGLFGSDILVDYETVIAAQAEKWAGIEMQAGDYSFDGSNYDSYSEQYLTYLESLVNGDITIQAGSAVFAKAEGDGDSLVNLKAGYNWENVGCITVNESTVDAWVDGSGDATVLMRSGDYTFDSAWDFEDLLYGDIDILNDSRVAAEVGGSGEAQVELSAGEDICFPASLIRASVIGEGHSAVEMYAWGGDISDDLDSLISAEFAGLLAQNNIGTEDLPIQTAVDTLCAYSVAPSGGLVPDLKIAVIPVLQEGDIYINEVDDIELGIYVDPLKTVAGGSVAANNGIIVITAAGDMLVNSIIAPRGGVFLESTTGSIYAGTGWCPAEWLVGNGLLLNGDGFDVPGPEFLGTVYGLPPMYTSDTGWAADDIFAFAPVVAGAELAPGPNVIAGSYSYFSAPEGTIGIGDIRDENAAADAYNPLHVCIQAFSEDKPAVPEGFVPAAGLTVNLGGVVPSLYSDGTLNGTLGVSGAFMGIVRPGVTAVTGVDPSADIDLTVPPLGYVFYDDNDEFCCCPAGVFESIPATNPVASAEYLVANQIWPALQPGSPDELLANALNRDLRAYYEIMDNYRFVSNEPVTPTNFFGYRPLRDADMTAFDEIELSEEAYDFISDNIQLKKKVPVYFE